MITEETIARMKQNLEVKNEFFVLDVIKHLEAQIENYKLSENESKEIIAELKGKLKKEQNLNKVIKERLVEVNCDCNAEKKEKCVMFPEYCEGERKTVVDLMSLVSDGLNESLIKQKDEQIKLLAKRITELQADKGRLQDMLNKVRCCQNCKIYKNKPVENAVHIKCTKCIGYSEWELPE